MIIKQKETGLVKRGNRGFVSKACAFICKGNSGKIFIKSICLSLLFLACDSPKGITDLSKPCPELKMKYQNRKVDVQRPFVEKESFSDLEKLDEPIGLGTKFTIHFSEEMHEKDLSEAVEKNYVFLVEKAVLESDRFKEDLQTISINEEFKSKFPKIKTTASLKDGKSILSGEILQELDEGSYVLIVHKLLRDKIGNGLSKNGQCQLGNYNSSAVKVLKAIEISLKSPSAESLANLDPAAELEFSFSHPVLKTSVTSKTVKLTKVLLEDKTEVLGLFFEYLGLKDGLITGLKLKPKLDLEESSQFKISFSAEIKAKEKRYLKAIEFSIKTKQICNQSPCFVKSPSISVLLDTSVTFTMASDVEAKAVLEIPGQPVAEGSFAKDPVSVSIKNLKPETSYGYKIFLQDRSSKKGKIVTGSFKTKKAIPTLKINEVFAAPNTSTFFPEFIELVNSGQGNIDLSAGEFSIKEAGDLINLKGNISLAPGDFLILRDKGAGEKAVKNFNGVLAASGQKVLEISLTMTNSKAFDLELHYQGSVIEKVPVSLKPVSGKSLERINPSCLASNAIHWLVSNKKMDTQEKDNFASPGQKNSQFKASCQ